MSSQLVWELVKKHNCFVRKAHSGAMFSAEAGNLYNKHSYKHSGLANAKSVDITADGEHVKFTVGRVKKAQNPKSAKHSVTIKGDGRRVIKAVGKQIHSYRPDLKSAAQARAAAVHKSLRVIKARK